MHIVTLLTVFCLEEAADTLSSILCMCLAVLLVDNASNSDMLLLLSGGITTCTATTTAIWNQSWNPLASCAQQLSHSNCPFLMASWPTHAFEAHTHCLDHHLQSVHALPYHCLPPSIFLWILPMTKKPVSSIAMLIKVKSLRPGLWQPISLMKLELLKLNISTN